MNRTLTDLEGKNLLLLLYIQFGAKYSRIMHRVAFNLIVKATGHISAIISIKFQLHITITRNEICSSVV